MSDNNWNAVVCVITLASALMSLVVLRCVVLRDEKIARQLKALEGKIAKLESRKPPEPIRPTWGGNAVPQPYKAYLVGDKNEGGTV